ncbi:MerR family transcriptional regulator [Aeromonas veronii]|uniref:MerR family transcriptional regulator n=1 Tax=Aeromonas TaxID=642 RepID=UPI0038DE6383
MVYLGIGAFSKKTGISAHSLRFFDSIGLLSPKRDSNGYRRYSEAQVAQAHMLQLLQRARIPNAMIKELLAGALGKTGLSQLTQYRQDLAAEIESLQQAHYILGLQLTVLAQAQQGAMQLDRPFYATLEATEVGLLELDGPPIGDFFAEIALLSANPAWYLLHDYGFILTPAEVSAAGYPLRQMFTRVPAHVARSPGTLAATRVMAMYSRGSLENNPAVYQLLAQLHVAGHCPAGPIYIRNVSGPALERSKCDFIIRIDIPIAESQPAI